jgi:hypothetical protein
MMRVDLWERVVRGACERGEEEKSGWDRNKA